MRVLLLLLSSSTNGSSQQEEKEKDGNRGVVVAGSVTSSLLPSFSASVIRLRASYSESKSATTAPTPCRSVGL